MYKDQKASRGLALLVLAGGALAACDARVDGTFINGDVEFSAPEGSGEPNLVATADGRVILTWFAEHDSGHALMAAVRSEHEWSEPVTVARGRNFFVNWADFPSLVELSDGAWVAHWLEKTAPDTYAYHVMLSRSTDRGTTWSEPMRAHQDDSPTEHGFVSMVPLDDGGAALLWLDGQSTGVGHDAQGEAPQRGAMQLRSNVLSATGELGAESQVDDRICDCCQTAMVQAADGLVAAYRDRSVAEIRDIAVRRLVDGEWSEPIHVGNDNWEIRGCPVNGPALAASGEDVAIAWFTGAGGTAKVSVAFSADGGATFGDGIPVDDGLPLGRTAVVLLENGEAIVAWLERVDGEAEVRARRVRPSGASSDSWVVTPTSPERRSGFPRMVRSGDELVFAWTIPGEDGGVRVAAGRLGI
jgi:hypothetical protein